MFQERMRIFDGKCMVYNPTISSDCFRCLLKTFSCSLLVHLVH